MANSTGIAGGMSPDLSKLGDVKTRLWFLLGALIVFRIGSFIPGAGHRPAQAGHPVRTRARARSWTCSTCSPAARCTACRFRPGRDAVHLGQHHRAADGGGGAAAQGDPQGRRDRPAGASPRSPVTARWAWLPSRPWAPPSRCRRAASPWAAAGSASSSPPPSRWSTGNHVPDVAGRADHRARHRQRHVDDHLLRHRRGPAARRRGNRTAGQ